MDTAGDARMQIVRAAHVAASGRRWPFADAKAGDFAVFAYLTRRCAATIDSETEDHVRFCVRLWGEALLAEAARRTSDGADVGALEVADAVLAARELLAR